MWSPSRALPLIGGNTPTPKLDVKGNAHAFFEGVLFWDLEVNHGGNKWNDRKSVSFATLDEPPYRDSDEWLNVQQFR